MNKNDALAKISHSLATEEAQVITPPSESYSAYVERLSQELIARVIDPVRVKVTSSCAAEGDFELFARSSVWGIARSADSWLLTLEAENRFALGFGPDATNIMMHGFSSSDALGEWCT